MRLRFLFVCFLCVWFFELDLYVCQSPSELEFDTKNGSRSSHARRFPLWFNHIFATDSINLTSHSWFYVRGTGKLHFPRHQSDVAIAGRLNGVHCASNWWIRLDNGWSTDKRKSAAAATYYIIFNSWRQTNDKLN